MSKKETRGGKTPKTPTIGTPKSLAQKGRKRGLLPKRKGKIGKNPRF